MQGKTRLQILKYVFRIFLLLVFPIFLYQNCAKVNFAPENFKSMKTDELASTCEDCDFQDSIKISVNGSNQARLKKDQFYPILIELGPQSYMNSKQSSLQIIAGDCGAYHSWASQGKTVRWTKNATANGDALIPGINDFHYDSGRAQEMDGCAWKACVQTTKGAQACLFLSTDDPRNPNMPPVVVNPMPQVPTMPTSTTTTTTTTTMPPKVPVVTTTMPPPTMPVTTTTMAMECSPGQVSSVGCPAVANGQSTKLCSASGKWGACQVTCNQGFVQGPSGQCVAPTCDMSTRPADRQTTRNCADLGPTKAGTYTVTTKYVCSGTQWFEQTSDDSASACASTCDPAMRPSDLTSDMACALVYGETYAGSFRVYLSYRCEGTTWVATSTNDAEAACYMRQCPGAAPAPTQDMQNCSDRDSSMAGTFTVTTNYSCNANYQWEPMVSDDYAESCRPAIKEPSEFYCGSWDGKSVSATVLWKKEGDIRYYIGTSGAAANTVSCVGLWNEVTGVWESSRICKYADERECRRSSLTSNPSYVYYPACPAGMAHSGDGCTWRTCYQPEINGYCADSDHALKPVK